MSWDDLVAVALVGTAKRSIHEADDLGVDLDPGIVAHSSTHLLAAAATAATEARAGVTTAAGPSPEPSAAPTDTAAVCSPTASQILELLLAKGVAVTAPELLLEHWLICCRSAGRRVPHAQLPSLLEAATKSTALRPATIGVLSERGRWLAEQVESWAWARAVAPTAAWDEIEHRWHIGSTVERSSALLQARTIDPALARELLETTWTTDKADVRAELLGQLKTGLGPDDEPFLEAALDDRSKLVRAVAVSLLDRLPESRRSARMIARLAPLVRTEGRLSKKLVIELPDKLDEGAARDGLTPRPGQRAPKSWMLQRIIGTVPLRWWTETLGWDPATIIARITEREHLIALGPAAVGQRDAEWSRALFQKTGRGELLASLDAATAERLTMDELKKGGGKVLPVDALRHCPMPWSPELSQVVLESLASGETEQRRLGSIRPLLGMGLNLSTIPRLAELIAGSAESHFLGVLHHTLTLRQSIEAEFSASSSSPIPPSPALPPTGA